VGIGGIVGWLFIPSFYVLSPREAERHAARHAPPDA
jgi:hypothetical protein